MHSLRLHIMLAILFCFAFVLASYNVMINGHFHIDACGHIIFHAHPYAEHNDSDQPAKNHSHSKFQLLVYEIITTLIFLLTVILLLFRIFLPATNWLGFVFSQKITLYSLIISPFRRGPPSI